MFRVSPRVSFKIGATYYYNFTNLIDNISDKGTGDLQGTKGSDNFLFTSFGVNFNLENPNKREKAPVLGAIPDSLFADLDTKDTDEDGVPDFQDECAGTPKGVLISKTGCPLDDDNDGIENFRDEEEKSTQPNPPVTVDGRNFTDDIISASLPKDSIALAHDMIEKAFANQMRIYGYPVKDFKQSLIDSITRGGTVDEAMEAKIDSLFEAIDNQYNQRQKEDNQVLGQINANGKEITAVEVPIVSSQSKEKIAEEMKAEENKQLAQNQSENAEIKKEQVANTNTPIEPEPEMLTPQERKAIEKIVKKNDDGNKGKEVAKTNSETAATNPVEKSLPTPTETVAQQTKEVTAPNPVEKEDSKGSSIKPAEQAKANTSSTTTKTTQVAVGKDLVPPQYKNFDFNTDGVLTGDEILKAIDMYTDGMLKMNSDDLFEMIDYYNSKMKNAKIIDYGVSKGVYIDGVLKIVKKDQVEETMTQKRKVPESLRRVDMNNDAEISAKEVDEIIKKHKAGSKVYSAEFVNELIDWFFED